MGFTSKQPGRKKERCLQTLTYEKFMFETNTVTSHVEQEGWVPMGMENQERQECDFGREAVQTYRKSLEAHKAALKS